MNNETPYYGIDLGTTYSAISFINDDGKPQLIDNCEGQPITASAVYFENRDNIVVGETAMEQGKIDNTKVAELIKREMGSNWSGEFIGDTSSPQMVAACILRYLAEGAKQNGHNVERVVITVPAYFGDKEITATKEAGAIAGFSDVKILQEPVAAALAYGISVKAAAPTVLVYDLGGGTFEITAVRMNTQGMAVLCSDGNHQLGGSNWDMCLESLLAQKFMEQCPSAGDPQEDPDSRYSLHVQTEKVKKKLSTSTGTTIAISHNGEKARVSVSRAEFEDATRHLLQETLDFTDKVLDMAQAKGMTEYTDFLLVGGSCFMPMVMEAVTSKYAERLGITPKLFEPNQAVCKGAAVYGLYLQEEPEPAPSPDFAPFFDPDSVHLPVVITVASKSYGIRGITGDGKPVISNLILRQDQVPCSSTRVFPISAANAATLPLIVYSNDCSEAVVDESIGLKAGESVMELTPGLPAGAPISVTFTLSKEGQLTLTAVDQTNNKELVVEFHPEGALSEKELKDAARTVGNLVVTN